MSSLPVLSELNDFNLMPQIHGGGDDGGGGLAGLLEGLLDGLTGLMEPGALSGLFGGILTLGYNVHPLLVHFPVALLTAYLFTDILAVLRKSESLQTSANWLLYLGTLGALAAVAAGLVAAQIVPHGEEVHAIMERHEFLGLTVASLSVLLSLWRFMAGQTLASGMGQGLNWFLGLLIGGCLFFGADLGGTMVYRYGVGVQKLQDARQAEQHEHGGQHESASNPAALQTHEQPASSPVAPPAHEHSANTAPHTHEHSANTPPHTHAH